MHFGLEGKTVLVLASGSGLGKAVAGEFLKEGADVVLAGRGVEKLERAAADLRGATGITPRFQQCDITKAEELHGLVRFAAQKHGSVDVLVNNAGTYCGRKTFTTDGIEKTLAVNHLAPFYLTHLLLPLIQAAPVGRVVTVSSNSHYHATLNPERVSNPLFYFGLWAYQSSKLANVLFSAEFNRRNSNPEVQAFAVDPGLVNTDIGLKETGPLARLVWRQRQQRGTSADIPARTILHVAAEPGLLGSNAVYWKDSAPLQPAKKALDPDLARRLWEESCRLCGLGGYFAGSSG